MHDSDIKDISLDHPQRIAAAPTKEKTESSSIAFAKFKFGNAALKQLIAIAASSECPSPLSVEVTKASHKRTDFDALNFRLLEHHQPAI